MNKNNDIEKIIKDKMNELSDSVDCFDRISARAFPEKNQDFSESGFTISDLENVTDRAKRFSIMKWTAAAVAAVLCITVVPKTNLVQNFFANIGSSENSFSRIISELENETELHDYTISDYSSDYYLDNDVLITPLFACPFKKINKDNANIRIYTRQINGFNTNQVYAVQYIGDFDESNIIAAAESLYKFNESDLEQAEKITSDNFYDAEYGLSGSAVQLNFIWDESGLIKENGKGVSVASFSYNAIVKNEDGVMPVVSEILYGHETESEAYFYDIISTTEHTEKVTLPDSKEMWKRSVYFNGNPADSETNCSNFIRTELFTDGAISINATCPSVTPFRTHKVNAGETVSIETDYAEDRISTIVLPSNESVLPTVHLFISPIAYKESVSVIFGDEEERYHLREDEPAIDDEALIMEEMRKREESLHEETKYHEQAE